MQVVLRPEAEQELLDAQVWYESKALGLGFEFGRAADVAVDHPRLRAYRDGEYPPLERAGRGNSGER